jgi:L-fucose isomerase
MNLAKRVAELISSQLRYPNGEAVDCVIAETCIGGVAEASACDDLFRRENVGVSLTVTPAGVMVARPWIWIRCAPKAVFGFNGTERPGAVYLAAVLAGHSQKGIPAFGIYGRDVQDAGDAAMPADVRGKILDFVQCGLAAALMRGKAYLSMGGTSMGIAGSMVDYAFWEKWLGMRVEDIDMTEFVGRMQKGQFDPEEFKRATAWVKEHCVEGEDYNSQETQRSREQIDSEWSDSVKMSLIARDLMVGNPQLAKMGLEEQAQGHGAIASGFQGQRQWTDHFPNGDFLEAILNTSFDWNGKRSPYIVATENDALNAATMLFRSPYSQILPKYLPTFEHIGARRLLQRPVMATNCRALLLTAFCTSLILVPAALDGTGQQQDQDGAPAMKPFWDITDDEVAKCLKATTWHPSITEYFPGGGLSTRYRTLGDMPATMTRINLVAGLGPAIQIAEGQTVELPDSVHDVLDQRTNPTWPTTWFAPKITGRGAFTSTYEVMNHWGANHCVMTAGHVGHLFITLASILRIPVYMHNVSG